MDQNNQEIIPTDQWAQNTKILKEKFPKIYKELFSNCSIVSSCAGTFLWSGEYACQQGGIAVVSKIPQRVYIGFEPIKGENKIEFGKIYQFHPQKYKFIEQANIDFLFHETKFINFVNEEITKILANFTSFRIHILSEIRDNSLTLFLPAFTAAMGINIFLYNKLIFFSDVTNIKKLTYEKYLQNNNYQKLFNFIHKLECFTYGDYSANTASWALLDFDFPLLEFTEKRLGSKNNKPTEVPANIYDSYDLLEKLDNYFIRLNDLMKTKNNPLKYMDFGLLYSGIYARSDATMQQIDYTIEKRNQIYSKIIPKIKEKITQDFQSKSIYKDLFEKGQVDTWEKLIEYLSFISLEIAYLFHQTGQIGETSELVYTIREYMHYFPVLNEDMVDTRRIAREIVEYCRKEWDALIATKSIGSGAGDCILFIIPRGFFEEKNVLKLTKHLRKIENNNDIYLDYASWIDGFEEEGIKLEQYLEAEVYSEFISQGSVVVKTLEKDKQSKNILSIEEFTKIKETTDLLVDKKNETIYLKGKELTSKDIVSTKTTIKILEILMKNIGKSVSNNQLPDSSYSMDRNEMQGKIIGPLIRTVRKHLNKDILIDITGGITEFRVSLHPSDIRIVFVEKEL
ncbi:MAG: hypothetical protein ACD_58C00330G0004 [uncultured bacterium]|nr:MAG: hypothetical protein ACD_58C00330G0004 [uncultured bacterium]